jgi:hypothetical protein
VVLPDPWLAIASYRLSLAALPKRDDANTDRRKSATRSAQACQIVGAGAEPGHRGAREHSGGVMASARTTYRDMQGADGAAAAAHPFVMGGAIPSATVIDAVEQRCERSRLRRELSSRR